VAGNSNPEPKRKNGPGRPFKKGQSGNPSGLPKPVHDFIRELQQSIRERCANKAVDTLEKCLDHPDGRVQMAAVREVFDRVPLPKTVAVTDAEGRPAPEISLVDIFRRMLAEGKPAGE
jgi:hypothetical protein